MTRIHKSTLIGAPIAEVYLKARDPAGWPTWFAGLTGPDSLDGDGAVGTKGDYTLALAGVNFPVSVEVVEDQHGPEGASWRGRIGGPLAGKHHWTYRPHGDQTEVTVDMEYTVPGAALGRLADKLIVERMMERNVQQSIDNLKLICEHG